MNKKAIIITVSSILVFGGLGYYFYSKKKKDSSDENSAKSTKGSNSTTEDYSTKTDSQLLDEMIILKEKGIINDDFFNSVPTFAIVGLVGVRKEVAKRNLKFVWSDTSGKRVYSLTSGGVIVVTK